MLWATPSNLVPQTVLALWGSRAVNRAGPSGSAARAPEVIKKEPRAAATATLIPTVGCG